MNTVSTIYFGYKANAQTLRHDIRGASEGLGDLGTAATARRNNWRSHQRFNSSSPLNNSITSRLRLYGINIRQISSEGRRRDSNQRFQNRRRTSANVDGFYHYNPEPNTPALDYQKKRCKARKVETIDAAIVSARNPKPLNRESA